MALMKMITARMLRVIFGPEADSREATSVGVIATQEFPTDRHENLMRDGSVDIFGP